MDSAGERFEAIRAALADRNNILTVKDLCELAGVSRSGYYNWVRSEKKQRASGGEGPGGIRTDPGGIPVPGLRKGRSRHSYHLFPDWNLVGNDCNHGSHHRAPCPLRQRRRAKHGSLCRRCNNPRRRNLWRPLLPHFEHHHSLLLGCRIGPHCTCKNTASLCSNLCCNWLHRVFDYWPHTVILCSTKCTAVLIEPPYK